MGGNIKSGLIILGTIIILLVVGSVLLLRRGETAVVSGADNNIYVDIYDSSKAYNGTTIFADLHDNKNTRIVEVDMQGRIVWQYLLPESLRQYTDPGFDVKVLSDNHVLFVLPLHGVYEIDRSGTIVWSYLDSKVSHDANRLANENTLVVWGGGDFKNDAQVKEINPSGQVVWSWYAKDHFNQPPYNTINKEGWTHTNAATRLQNGNTLVNLRNFALTVEVNPAGDVVWSYDWHSFGDNADPHDPEILSDNHLLIALQNDSPYSAVEIDRSTGENVWHFSASGLRTTRDADRLPNGNTLLVTVSTVVPGSESRIIEVTPSGEVVWRLRIINAPVGMTPGWIYKADRIGTVSHPS